MITNFKTICIILATNISFQNLFLKIYLKKLILQAFNLIIEILYFIMYSGMREQIKMIFNK